MNTNKRINWEDGMLINKTHFKGIEDFLLSNIYITNKLLAGFGYGIIDNFTGDTNYPYIKISVDSSDGQNQKIIVHDLNFNALTSSGTLISVTNENFYKQKANIENTLKQLTVDVEEQKINHGDPLYLVMLIQPFNTTGTGKSDPDEEPLRFRNCVPVAELKCVRSTSTSENIVGPNHFPIAKIKIINHKLEIDNNYIPPCFNSGSHSKLKNRVVELKKKLADISENIALFIESNQEATNQNTLFLKNVYFLLYPHLIELLEWFSDECELLAPDEIFKKIRVFALQFKKLLLCSSEAYKHYTESWNLMGINFHSFSTEIDNLTQINLCDLIESLEACERILVKYLLKFTAGHSTNNRPDSDIIL